MIKLLLPAALLLLSVETALAQDAPEKPATNPAPVVRNARPGKPAPDSAVAVRNLFRKRRNGGTFYAGAGGLLALRSVLADGDVNRASTAIISVPLLAIGIGKLVRFGSKKEEEYIKDYRAGKPLPAHIRRRIRPDYFRPKD